jgi:hypothetical protein
MRGDDDEKKDQFSSPNPFKNKVCYKKLNMTFTQEDLIKILDDPTVQHELLEFERSFVTPYEIQP